MEFVNAADMARAFERLRQDRAPTAFTSDTDKDTLRADSNAMLDEISHLLTRIRKVRLHVVGHHRQSGYSRPQPGPERRRAATVVHALTRITTLPPLVWIPSAAGPYAPVASNADEDGQAKIVASKLVKW